ncbi:MAG: hypothetical protein JXR68_14160 [Bacteroidales bacterium]|nr:hypothetical protein [Bacteroidales bacterium]
MPAQAENINKVISTKAKLSDTIELVKEFARAYSWQVSDLAQDLKGQNDYETGFNIWSWVKNNIQYEEDSTKREKEKGKDVERVRTPARTIADKKGDCDCMTTLVCALLIENDINPFAKIVAYPIKNSLGQYEKNILGNYKTEGFGHIYSFFYYENEPVFIDTVPQINEYNTEYFEPIVKQKIINIMELQALYGTDEMSDPNILTDEQILNRVVIIEDENGSKTSKDIGRALIYGTLNNFEKQLSEDIKRPAELKFYDNPAKELKIIHLVLASKDANDLTNNLLEAVQNSDYKELYKDILEEIQNEENTGNYSIYLVPDENERLNIRVDNSLEGLFTRKNKKVKKDKKPSKLFNTAKKITLAPARGAFLTLVKLNFLRLGEKLVVGEMSENEAEKIGISSQNHKKFAEAKIKFLENWEKFGGKTEELEKAISKSKANKKLSLNGIDDLEVVLSGLGIIDPVTASATLAATATPIIVAMSKAFKNLDLPKTASKGIERRITAKNELPADKGAEKQTFYEKLKNGINKAKTVVQNFKGDTNAQDKMQVLDDEPTVPDTKRANNNTKIFIIGGAVLIIAIILIIVFTTKNKNLKGTPAKKTTPKKRKPAIRKTTAVAKRKPATSKTTAVAKRKPATSKTTAVAKRKPATKRSIGTTPKKRKPATSKTTAVAKRRPATRKITGVAKRRPTTHKMLYHAK